MYAASQLILLRKSNRSGFKIFNRAQGQGEVTRLTAGIHMVF